MLLMGGFLPPAVAQIAYSVPDCNQPQQYDFVIGNPVQVTVYSGGRTFIPGNYHVLGDLYLKDGAYEFQTGVFFYVDGKIVTPPGKSTRLVGYSITLGANAKVTAIGAVFNAACTSSMWRGFVFDPAQTQQSLIMTRCYVGNAQYGLWVQPQSTGAYYSLDDCDFQQNLYHVLDYGYHLTAGNLPTCTIRDCRFYSQPNLLPPYQAVGGLESWTYEALHLTPTGNADGQPKILLRGRNTITGGIYGLVANMPGQSSIYQDGGSLTVNRIVSVGIWLDVLKESVQSFPAAITIGMNNITAGRTYKTMWTGAAGHQYGLVVSEYTGSIQGYTLDVVGASGAGDTTAIRAQTGAFLDGLNEPIKNYTLKNLTYGLSLRAGSATIAGNSFYNCLHGLRIRPNTGAYTADFDISCNTFTPASNPTSSGIYIGQNATLNDQGSLTYPVGNLFQNYANGDRSIVNDGVNPLTYYRYTNSTDEQIVNIKNDAGSQVKGTVTSTTNPFFGLADYCQNLRGVATGVQMRGTSRAGLMHALMDTLRRQAAPAARLGRYQAAIRAWMLREEPDTAAFDAYVRTLAPANPGAFLGLGLDLLEQYRRTGRRLLAKSLYPLLAARTNTWPAAADRLALSDVLNRLGQSRGVQLPGQRWASVADSLTLRRLMRSANGTAETAALWYNYLYPKANSLSGSLRPAHQVASASLGESTTVFYPNPSSNQLHVEVNAPAGPVALRLTNLISGKVVLQMEVKASGSGLRQAEVDVQAVPTGQYAAAVLVNGVPVTTEKIFINH